MRETFSEGKLSKQTTAFACMLLLNSPPRGQRPPTVSRRKQLWIRSNRGQNERDTARGVHSLPEPKHPEPKHIACSLYSWAETWRRVWGTEKISTFYRNKFPLLPF